VVCELVFGVTFLVNFVEGFGINVQGLVCAKEDFVRHLKVASTLRNAWGSGETYCGAVQLWCNMLLMLTLEAWLMASSRKLSADICASDYFCRANGVIPWWMLSICGGIVKFLYF